MENCVNNAIVTKGRNLFIDNVKAFTIILVVIGHCIQYGSGNAYLDNADYFDNQLFSFIYSFHMPLFMLISGYLFNFSLKKRTYSKVLLHRFRGLIIPIFSWGLVSLLFYIRNMLRQGCELDAITIVDEYFSSVVISLWFLWAVFGCSVIVLLTHSLFNNSIWAYFLFFLITFLLPDAYNLGLYNFIFPFFVIGFLCGHYELISKWNKKLDVLNRKGYSLLIMSIIFFGLWSFYDRENYIYISGYSILNKDIVHQLSINFYRLIIGLIGSAWGLLLLNKLKYGILQKIFSYIGKETLGIYIISEYLNLYVLRPFMGHSQGYNFGFVLLQTAIVITVCLLIISVIRCSKIADRCLLGR